MSLLRHCGDVMWSSVQAWMQQSEPLFAWASMSAAKFIWSKRFVICVLSVWLYLCFECMPALKERDRFYMCLFACLSLGHIHYCKITEKVRNKVWWIFRRGMAKGPVNWYNFAGHPDHNLNPLFQFVIHIMHFNGISVLLDGSVGMPMIK